MNFKVAGIASILALLSTPSLAVQCGNSEPDNSDDFNLTLRSYGLTNGHIVEGDAVTLEARTSWLYITMKNKTKLNTQLFLDNSLEIQSTARLGDNGPTVSRTVTDLSRGIHNAEARSSNDSSCYAPGTFVVQSAPKVDAGNNISIVLDANSAATTANVSFSGDIQYDSEYSLKKGSPDISWDIGGNNYDGESVSVDLSPGTYVAKLSINDGIFKDSDSKTVKIIDQLQINSLRAEMLCSGGVGEITLDWSTNSSADDYEMEHKRSGGSWRSLGSTHLSYESVQASGTNVYDQFRVRACSNSRCGEWKQKGYYTPDCGNFNPN